MKITTLRFALLAVLAASATACGDRNPAAAPGGSGQVDSATTAAADLALAPAAADPHDPCRLLASSEVEAVLGGPLAGAPYLTGNPDGDSGGVPDDTGDVCWYSTKDNHNLTISAEWTDGGAISSGVNSRIASAENASKGMLKLQDGTELTGDWDEASIRGCCTFVALQGDSLVEINFAGTPASQAQVAPLVNAALARLGKPLDLSGRAGNAAALARENARFSTKDPCSYWSADDIRNLLGATLKGEPERSGQDCLITYLTPDQRSHQFNITVTPRNGYRSFRRDNATYAGFARGINADNAGSVALKPAEALAGPWEAAENGPIQFSAVRHDAHIALRQGGMSIDAIRAIVGHAFDRIDAGGKP
jgi:hypothetical protein